MIGAESATKLCRQCLQAKPLSEFYARRNGGGYYHRCKACYHVQSRAAWASDKPEKPPAPPPPPPPSQPAPIPLSERVARIQRDAQELTWILRRYMIRDKRGVCYIRLRPDEDDPKRRAVVVAVEKLVCAVWDSGIGNAELGFRPVDPRTNKEVLDARR